MIVVHIIRADKVVLETVMPAVPRVGETLWVTDDEPWEVEQVVWEFDEDGAFERAELYVKAEDKEEGHG